MFAIRWRRLTRGWEEGRAPRCSARLLHRLLHLLRGHIFHVRVDVPRMSKGISHPTGAIAIEHVLGRTHSFRASRNRLIEDGIHFFHVKEYADGRATVVLWRVRSNLRTFVR